MKRRIFAGAVLALSLLAFIILNSYGKINEYLETKAQIEADQERINELDANIDSLKTEFFAMGGDDSRDDLKSIMAFIYDFEDIEVESIRAFTMEGEILHFLKNITNPNDSTLCDGYEITVTSSSVLEFTELLGESGITFHSIDLMLGSETLIIRALSGGGL